VDVGDSSCDGQVTKHSDENLDSSAKRHEVGQVEIIKAYRERQEEKRKSQAKPRGARPS
jgi:hypothetical protein